VHGQVAILPAGHHRRGGRPQQHLAAGGCGHAAP
jgi:hypothetical protein